MILSPVAAQDQSLLVSPQLDAIRLTQVGLRLFFFDSLHENMVEFF